MAGAENTERGGRNGFEPENELRDPEVPCGIGAAIRGHPKMVAENHEIQDITTPWQFKITMQNGPSIDDVPIET